MNDRAREALVRAALNGVPQITHNYRDPDGGPGRCAMGVLYEDAGLKFEPQTLTNPDAEPAMREAYGLSTDDWSDIVQANDRRGWDFLTIARKIGNADENA